jgi:hypothetical protein
MDVREKARNILPLLIELAKSLTDLSIDIVNFEKRPNRDADHFGFMSFCFLCKQIENLKAIVLLYKAEDYKNAAVIARSSIEGMALILWAYKEPSERALSWRKYIIVEDYLRSLRNGIKPINNQDYCDLEQVLIREGKQFLTNKSKSKEFPWQENDFHKNWYGGKSVDKIFEDVEGELLYKICYKDHSSIIHWTPRGLATSLHEIGNNKIFSSKSCFDIGATALINGFHALIQTLVLFNFHLDLGFDDKIQNLYDNYVKVNEEA